MQAATISSSKCIVPNAVSFKSGANKARAAAARPARKTVVAASSGDANEVMSISEMAQPMASQASLFELAGVRGSSIVAPSNAVTLRPQPPLIRPFVPAAAGVCAVGMGAKILMDLNSSDKVDYTKTVDEHLYIEDEEEIERVATGHYFGKYSTTGYFKRE